LLSDTIGIHTTSKTVAKVHEIYELLKMKKKKIVFNKENTNFASITKKQQY